MLDKIFSRLRDEHQKLGVSWRIYEKSDDVICFHSFARQPRCMCCKCGSGLGRKCLIEFLELADEHMLSVSLFTSVPNLVELYKSVGFFVVREQKNQIDMFRPYGWRGHNESLSTSQR